MTSMRSSVSGFSDAYKLIVLDSARNVKKKLTRHKYNNVLTLYTCVHLSQSCIICCVFSNVFTLGIEGLPRPKAGAVCGAADGGTMAIFVGVLTAWCTLL